MFLEKTKALLCGTNKTKPNKLKLKPPSQQFYITPKCFSFFTRQVIFQQEFEYETHRSYRGDMLLSSRINGWFALPLVFI